MLVSNLDKYLTQYIGCFFFYEIMTLSSPVVTSGIWFPANHLIVYTDQYMNCCFLSCLLHRAFDYSRNRL